MSPFTKFFIFAVIVADLFALVIFGGRLLLDGTILSHAGEAPIVVAGAEETQGATAATAAAEPAFDYATYVADAARGEKIAGKCKACHTFGQGEPHRTGPNMWGIVGASVGHAEGFSYSAANASFKSTHPTWTEEALFTFLENPREVMPGTKMQFNGIKKPNERADLIAWLKTLK